MLEQNKLNQEDERPLGIDLSPLQLVQAKTPLIQALEHLIKEKRLKSHQPLEDKNQDQGKEVKKEKVRMKQSILKYSRSKIC